MFVNNPLMDYLPNTIGQLSTSLEQFIAGASQIKGTIPREIGNLSSLVDMDLSANELTGTIPEALQGLIHIQRLYMDGNKSTRLKVMLYTILGIAAALLSSVFALLWYRSRRRRQKESNGLEALEEFLGLKPKVSYYELQQATEQNSECNLLGKGSFGFVYKGTLRNGALIAVKVFNLHMENAFKSFERECEVFRKLLHRNLAKVMSCCSNEDFKALVLDYMPNGSLDKWLCSNDNFLDFIQSLDIIIDVSCALEYLHHGYKIPVVHCDLKPSNVLLDESMVAHVSDFGIAKLLGDGCNFSRTQTLATFGYIAPEYGLDGLISTKCDVYSFGILLMECFTRRKPNNDMFGGDLSLKQWINDSMPYSLVQVADANLFRPEDERNGEKLQCLESIMQLALNCTKEYPGERPLMKDT